MLGMSSVWIRNNIRTKEDIKEYYKKLEDEIVNIIKRKLTTYEKICIEDLIYKYFDEKGFSNAEVQLVQQEDKLSIFLAERLL